MEIDPILLKRINPVIAGILIAAVIPFMRKLFDLDIRFYRKWGWNRLADSWEKRKDRWVPISQWICGILAAALFLAAIFFPDEWAQYFRVP
jgi:hypothetical protein